MSVIVTRILWLDTLRLPLWEVILHARLCLAAAPTSVRRPAATLHRRSSSHIRTHPIRSARNARTGLPCTAAARGTGGRSGAGSCAHCQLWALGLHSLALMQVLV
jgi:hypothetical protein